MSDSGSSHKGDQVYSLAHKRQAALAELDNASFKYAPSPVVHETVELILTFCLQNLVAFTSRLRLSPVLVSLPTLMVSINPFFLNCPPQELNHNHFRSLRHQHCQYHYRECLRSNRTCVSVIFYAIRQSIALTQWIFQVQA